VIPALANRVLATAHALGQPQATRHLGGLNAGKSERAMRSIALKSQLSRVDSSSTGVIQLAHEISLLSVLSIISSSCAPALLGQRCLYGSPPPANAGSVWLGAFNTIQPAKPLTLHGGLAAES
jgi:hypothetical protein